MVALNGEQRVALKREFLAFLAERDGAFSAHDQGLPRRRLWPEEPGPRSDDLLFVETLKRLYAGERFTVDLASGGQWNIQGNITDHEYEISGPNGKVATVGKRWFRLTDTYGVEVEPGQDDGLALAVAVVVDQISHPRG